MTVTENNSSEYVGPKLGGFATKLSWYARQKMFDLLMALANPSADTTVLDVGVTSDRREDCNFFEKLYPYPHQITAVGMEDAAFLEEEYPGLKYVRSDGSSLPFPDKSFDLVVSFAVIEHVGSRDQQKAFVRELCRVGKTCCITTPNRWYPVEFHTAVPLIHWLPSSWFRALLRLLGKHFFAKEENLNLLSEKDVLKMLPADAQVSTRHFRLLGLISNLLFYVKNPI
ncbi:class I SAM-dependent methyltransferase [Microcoleus sp. ARI1-B5]|uniref:class I SAM-dependent methyltransferase n=1 Tax=unclassified Microcoleus TaxID=2642155 RepID=UPI002FCF5FF8